MEEPVRELIKQLIIIEGGFTDDPVDRGGKTKYGLTEETARDLGYSGRIKELTEKKAIDLYYIGYFLPNRYDELDDTTLQYRIMNIAIHTSSARLSKIANKMLQRAYNDFHRENDKVTVDGIIGPETIKAVNSYKYPDAILKSLKVQQGEYYRNIVNKDESQKRFIRGWFNRLEKEG